MIQKEVNEYSNSQNNSWRRCRMLILAMVEGQLADGSDLTAPRAGRITSDQHFHHFRKGTYHD
jgi:hypothetical protein